MPEEAEDRMVGIIEKHGESIKLSLIADPRTCISELLGEGKTGRQQEGENDQEEHAIIILV